MNENSGILWLQPILSVYIQNENSSAVSEYFDSIGDAKLSQSEFIITCINVEYHWVLLFFHLSTCRVTVFNSLRTYEVEKVHFNVYSVVCVVCF